MHCNDASSTANKFDELREIESRLAVQRKAKQGKAISLFCYAKLFTAAKGARFGLSVFAFARSTFRAI